MTANDNEAGTAPWLEPVAPEEARRPGGARRPARLLFALLSAIAPILLGLLAWSLYRGEGPEGEPVTVRAEPGPVKIKPEDAGGMDVPHRDKLVFSRVSGEGAEQAENPRPLPEEPLPRPQVPALEPALADAGGIVGAAEAVAADPTRHLEGELPADRWAIQVAAFRNYRDARGWMAQAVTEHDEVFDGLMTQIVEGQFDLVTYHRVRFGPFESREAARAKCREVEAVELNCIVVPPS